MGQTEKEELKTIKVKASTHARLSIISAALGKTIAELIDELLEKTHPEINAEADRALKRIRTLNEKDDI